MCVCVFSLYYTTVSNNSYFHCVLLQESHACPLSGAVSLCNPFNLVIADEDFRKGFNIVYDITLANALRKIFKK